MPVVNNKKHDEEEEDSDLPPPPDGGWGWVVVFGSFMIHIVTDGVTYSFGVFYDEFLDYFNEGKGATAWILSTLVGVTLCSGPISSSLVNKWGCRAVTIAGSIIGAICLLLSVWAQNVTTLYFTIGIGTGLGFGLIYLPAIVSVTTYFEKKRSLATGIAVCGSGFGTFIFAPIITFLLSEYGWRGAMLIISAVVLQCIIFGALFRPLEMYETEECDIKSNHCENHSIPQHITLKAANAETDLHVSVQNISTIDKTNDDDTQIQRPHSMCHFAKIELNGNIPNGKPKTSETARLALSQPLLLTSTQSEGHYKGHYGSQNLRRPGILAKPDVFYQGSLNSLRNAGSYRSRLDMKRGEEADLMEKSHSSFGHKCRRDSERNETTVCGCIPCSEDTKDTLREMLDFALFKDVIFILFTLSNFLTSIGFNIPYVYIVSRAKTLNISAKEASMLLSIIGIANTLGRIVLGYISDKPWVNRLQIYNWCLILCGLATTFSAFCIDFYSLAIYSTVFGFTIGAYVGLTSVILVDLLGLDKLTNAFGLLLLFQGIASLIGPPIAGELYDLLQSYDPGFYLAGITIALSGAMLFAIPPIQRWQKTKKKNSDI